ncbi:MAG: iron complex outermembrane receptor protein [Flavobacteriales bacterium]|jgi:iron complex outermembrane receptor protein
MMYVFKPFLAGITVITYLCVPFATVTAGETETKAKVQYFDLPGQPLQSGLIEYALQAGVSVIVDDTLIESFRSSPVIGPQTVEGALTALLARAPLEFVYLANADAYVIRHSKDEPVVVSSEPPPETHVEPAIDEILVVGTQYPFRYTTVSNTQLHGAVPYFDSSRFLNTIPQTLIRDRQPKELSEVLEYASGITPGDGVSDSNDDVYIRGFQRHAIYVDGFRLGDSNGTKLLPANVERIEILKGPSTLHYGQAEPGGVVNVIRKKPLSSSPFIHLSAGAGSSGRKSLALDVNQSVAQISDLDYRVIAASEQQSEAGDISDIERYLIASSLRWQPKISTTLDMGYEYQQSSRVIDRNVEVFLPVDDVFPGASLSDAARQARPDFESNFNLFSAELNHYFTSDWRLRLRAFWQKEYRYGVRTTGEQLVESDVLFKKEELGNDFLVLVPGGQVSLPIVLDLSAPELLYSIGPIRSLFDENSEETGSNINLNIEGGFETGGLVHHVLGGADWHWQNIDKQYIVERRTLFVGQSWNDFDFSEALPNIAAVIFDSAQPFGVFEEDRQRLDYTDIGLFVQDNMEINQQWLASLGVRATHTEGEYIDVSESQSSALQTYENISSQLGVVNKYFDSHSIYANYSEGLRANYHIDDIGSEIVDPELSHQFEIGLKSLWWGGKAQSSVAVYSVEKQNVVEFSFIDGVRTLVEGNDVRVTGADLDVSVQATPKLDIITAISSIDATIVTGANSGKTPAMAAELTASVFSHYQFNHTLDLNVGYKFVSERFGDNANVFALPQFATLDMGASYAFNLGGAQCQAKDIR